jgi:hypothetical protein
MGRLAAIRREELHVEDTEDTRRIEQPFVPSEQDIPNGQVQPPVTRRRLPEPHLCHAVGTAIGTAKGTGDIRRGAVL